MQRPDAPPQAVILVGGQGTRLRPYTLHTPKPMLPVLNRPFLEHTIALLKQGGVSEVILALGYLPGAIQGYFGDGSRAGVRLVYAVEDEPLGTAGAVKNAEPHIGSTVVILNGDIFTELDIAEMLAFHRRREAVVTIALTWVENPSAFGVVEVDGDSRVRRFIEKPSPDQVTSNWINAGVYILEPEVLSHVPAGSHHMFEKGLFPHLIELGEPVYGYPYRGYWLDMGTMDNYLRLNRDLLLSEVGSPIITKMGRDEVRHEGEVNIHPSAEITGPSLIGARCDIGRGARVTGPAVIGTGCHIGEGAIMEKVVVWGGASIAASTRLENCIVGGDIE